MRALFSAIFGASFLSLLSPHRLSLFFFLFHEGYHTLPINALPYPRFRPKLISTFFFPSPCPPSLLFCSVKSITGMGAVRRFSRGELGLNSVKCPVKHINTTFDFSFLFSFSIPRRWTSCGSTSTDSCLAWARRRSTRWSSTMWPSWWVLLSPLFF